MARTRKPKVFISANSGEFKFLRQVVTEELLRKNCEPIAMDHFSTSSGNLQSLLEEKVAESDSVICLIGSGLGTTAPSSPGAPLRSYTQLEFDIAQRLGKPTYIFIKSDLKHEGTDPLQKAFIDSITSSNLLWHNFGTENALRRHILGINNEEFFGKHHAKQNSGKGSRSFRYVSAVLLVLSIASAGFLLRTTKNETRETQIPNPTPSPSPSQTETPTETTDGPPPPSETLISDQIPITLKAGTLADFTLLPGMTKTFVWCPPGEFTMGFSREERGAGTDDRSIAPPFTAVVPEGFWIARYELTQSEASKCREVDDFNFESEDLTISKSSQLPLSGVTWTDANRLCELFSKRRNDGKIVSLPLEYQWEYAARAGSATPLPYSFGFELNGKDANCDGRNGSWSASGRRPGLGITLHRPAEVGSYSPNDWGIFDMHGNVREWCLDYYLAPYRSEGRVTAPAGPITGTLKVIRGGSFDSYARTCRSGARDSGYPHQQLLGAGIRLVISKGP